MTFSLIGRCERSGMIGFAGVTSELAAGGRFPHAKAQIGAVITQALTNPYLGHLGIKLLETGYAPHKVLDEIVASDTHVEFRQLGVMDRFGRTAARTGKNNLDVAEHIAESNLIALGNRVKAGVVGAIAEGFRAASDEDLEERLMRALEAGRDAGTYFWIDPEKQMIVVIMVQSPKNRRALRLLMRNLVYDALEK